jgi:hypothetical protein
MECFGISENDGTIYEGDLRHGFRPPVQPLIVPIQFPAFTLTKWDPNIAKYSPALFREDFFDPITRIRRGRVFVMRQTSQPHTWTVHDPFRPRPQLNIMNREERVYFYERSSLGPLREAPLNSANHIAIIGNEPFISFWKIVGVETSVHSTPILTLKSYRSLGDLPELDLERIPDEIRTKLEELLESVANSNHRAGAVDVVDRSRAALSLILGHLACDRGSDLGVAIKKVQAMAPNRLLVCHAASIVARLHPRGKPNEEFNHGTRPVSEEDAQLAIGCLGLVLKETGWAKF